MSQIQIILGAVILIALTGGGIYIHHRIDKGGYDRCQNEVKEAQAEANTQVLTKKKVIRHETQNLDRDGIVKQLCSAGWVRTPKDCPK